jgi:heme/copper-type cytochrome/quinol oxidase subunit 4
MKKIIQYIRSLKQKTKYYIFIFTCLVLFKITSTCFLMGQENVVTAINYVDWKFAFFVSGLVVLFFYWLLFGFKSNNNK